MVVFADAGKWHKPWFFKHVESFLDSGKDTEFIPLRDYYHRYWGGGFRMGLQKYTVPR